MFKFTAILLLSPNHLDVFVRSGPDSIPTRRLPASCESFSYPNHTPNDKKYNNDGGQDSKYISGHLASSSIWIEKVVNVESFGLVSQVGEGNVEGEDDD